MTIYLQKSDQERVERLSIPEPNSGCWLWLGSIKKNGYGNMAFGGSFTQAHRVSYMAFKGEIPSGFVICHSCDNPSCVNPDHLWHGTYSDNMKDASKKGRNKVLRKKLSATNSSGVIGVGWNKQIGKWKVWVRKFHLGYFDSFEEAVSVRRKAELDDAYKL